MLEDVKVWHGYLKVVLEFFFLVLLIQHGMKRDVSYFKLIYEIYFNSWICLNINVLFVGIIWQTRRVSVDTYSPCM